MRISPFNIAADERSRSPPPPPPCKNPLLYAVANCLESLADCEGEDRTNYLDFRVERDIVVTIGND